MKKKIRIRGVLVWLILIGIFICAPRVYAAEGETYGWEYAYKIKNLDLSGIEIKKSTNVFQIESSKVELYDNPVLDTASNEHSKKLHCGKIILYINTECPHAASYKMQGVAVSKYTIKEPTSSLFSEKTKETKSNFYRSATMTTTIPIGDSPTITVASWQLGSTNTDIVTYMTMYDLVIVNKSKTDFLKYADGSYLNLSNWKTDVTANIFKISSDIYLAGLDKLKFQSNVQLPFGKTLTVLDSSEHTDAAGYLDLRTDRKINVSNGDKSISRDYTIHAEMPWKISIPAGSLRNYGNIRIKYTDLKGEYNENTEPVGSTSYSIDNVPAGTTVRVSLNTNNSAESNKVISNIQLKKSDGSAVAVKILPNSNIFTFEMPADVITFPEEVDFSEADESLYHKLSAEVTKTSRGEKMGTVTFQDESGNEIDRAVNGQQITAIADPMTNIDYAMFSFDKWESSDVEFSSASSSTMTFTMPEKDVSLTANFKIVGTNVELESSDTQNIGLYLMYESSPNYFVSVSSAKETVKNGLRISAKILQKSTAYEVSGWEVYKGEERITEYDTLGSGSPILTTDGTPIRIKAIVSARTYNTVEVVTDDTSIGSVSVGDGTDKSATAFAGDEVKLVATTIDEDYAFDHWEVISPSQDSVEESSKIVINDPKSATTKFTMISDKVDKIVIKAVFTKVRKSKATELKTLSLTDTVGKNIGRNSSQGNDYTVTLPDNLTKAEAEALVAKTFKLKFTLSDFATATFNNGTSYTKEQWEEGQEVSGFTLNQSMTIHVTAENKTDTQDYTLTIAWNAKTDKELTAVTLQDSKKNDLGTGVASGTDWTVTLSQDLTQTEVDKLFKDGFYLKLTISDRAKAALEGTAGWTKEAWGEGKKVVILKLNEAKKLTVTAENESTKEYTIKVAWSPKPTSKEKDLTGVELLDKDNKQVIAKGTLDGTAWTVEIPEDKYTKQQASDLAVGGSYLKLVASAGAKIEQKDGYTDNGADLEPWSSGNITTNMTLNKPYTFTVIAENGSTKIYTITLSYPTEKPVLKAGTVTRSSDQEAKAVFSSTLAGKYYWAVVEQGEKEPNISTSYAGSTAKKGNNTVTLTSLEAGAKDLYIVVKSTDGEISDPLKIEIPAYDAAAKEYAIALNYPTAGGTLKASATKAKAGDKITITVTPKAGYKLTPGTLKYSESSSTGAVVNIDETTFTFTMPASEISISCTWTAESTDQPETTTGKIGAFVVNGVSGTVDNTTGLITVTLPNGTDLTSLAPVITISGAKSISPASGATVDLSSPVTYTLTLEDGTTKTYTVRAYVEAPSKSDQLWNDMLNNVDGSPDHSGSKTWWKKAKDLKKHNDYPEYW